MLYQFANMTYPLQEGEVLPMFYLGGTLGLNAKRYIKVETIDKTKQQFVGFDVARKCYRRFYFDRTIIAM